MKIFCVVLVGMLFMLATGCNPLPTPTSPPSPASPIKKPCCEGDMSFLGSDYQAAREQAQASGKLMFVTFGATWCGPCHQFDQTLAAADLSKFVAVKVDVDANRELATRFIKGRGIPSYGIVDPKTESWVKGPETGYVGPTQFNKWLNTP